MCDVITLFMLKKYEEAMVHYIIIKFYKKIFMYSK